MKPFLPDDRGLPLFLITVQLAATIFAYELDTCKGQDYFHDEIAIFANAKLPGSTSGVRGWQDLGLRGRIKLARDAIAKSICQSIDSNRLKPLIERRDLAGKLIAAETGIGLSDAANWAEAHGLQLGDWFGEHGNEEEKLAENVLSYLDDSRDRMRGPDAFERARETESKLDNRAVLDPRERKTEESFGGKSR